MQGATFARVQRVRVTLAAFPPPRASLESFAERRRVAGGAQVKMPSALTGLPDRSADPEIAAIQDELADLNKRLVLGDLQIPPEHERSPSPEPIYDRRAPAGGPAPPPRRRLSGC